MKRTKQGDLNLPRNLTVERAEGFCRDLQTVAEDGGDLVFFGDRVESADIAGLQLLVATRAMARAAERPFAIRRPSAALRDTLALSGLGDLLEEKS
jgi:anti-anti-sigma regulatory factor